MPSKSAKQHRFMEAAAHNPAFAKKAGIPQKVAKLEIQIVRTIERLKGLYSDLEAEDQKMLDKLARAQADAEQMSLFGIDALPKKKREPKAKVTKLSVVPNGNGEHASDELAAEGAA